MHNSKHSEFGIERDLNFKISDLLKMSNLRDLELNITNRTFSKKRNEQRRTHEDSHADVQELIGLLTLRRVRLREWIHWAVSAACMNMAHSLSICLFSCRSSSTVIESMIAS